VRSQSGQVNVQRRSHSPLTASPGPGRAGHLSWRGRGRAFGACCFADKLRSPGGPGCRATVAQAATPTLDPTPATRVPPRRLRAPFPLVMPLGGVERPRRVVRFARLIDRRVRVLGGPGGPRRLRRQSELTRLLPRVVLHERRYSSALPDSRRLSSRRARAELRGRCAEALAYTRAPGRADNQNRGSPCRQHGADLTGIGGAGALGSCRVCARLSGARTTIRSAAGPGQDLHDRQEHDHEQQRPEQP
jgi:hypothetical protein